VTTLGTSSLRCISPHLLHLVQGVGTLSGYLFYQKLLALHVPKEDPHSGRFLSRKRESSAATFCSRSLVLSRDILSP
jgi:hypothetical protein